MYIKTLLNINKSGTLITGELIPQRYNTVSRTEITQPDETGINSTTTAKINTVVLEPKEEPSEKKERPATTNQIAF